MRIGESYKQLVERGSTLNSITLRSIFALAVLALTFGCTAGADRGEISRTSLTSTEKPQAPVENRYFMAIDGAHAKHRFLGAIRIPEHAMQTDPKELSPTQVAGKKTQLFPGMTIHFVSRGEYLLPVERDLIAPIGSDSFWQIQVSPGRVWSEKADGSLSRASFPFILTSNIENETYNGLATFLFDDDGVSNLRYQIVHQLSPFLVTTWFVGWGQVDVGYESGGVNEGPVIAEFEQELADRLVWRDWSELEEKHGAELLNSFDSDIAPEKTVMSGLAIDGEIYLRSAHTPFGPYPYPREMRHGVWSVSKTATGLMTMLRMAQKYGDEIFDYKIADYLDVSEQHDGWAKVTFADALNMATGIGTGSNAVDPNDIYDGYIYSDYDDYVAWYLAPTLEEKLEYVFDVPSHPWGPGEYARYRDRDTFALAAALDALYREKEGADADLWGMMLDEVYAPLGIHHMPMNLSKESDRPGVPFLGWGLYTTADEIVKIAQLLQNGGMHNGVQLLSKSKLAEALYQTEIRGLPSGSTNQYGAGSYHLSVWHYPYQSKSGKHYTTPRMLGWGGVVIQMMPNGMTAFRFGNGGSKPFEEAVRIADSIRAFDEID
jgi:CubicO group peptidase (beta-lactamase class C family)